MFFLVGFEQSQSEEMICLEVRLFFTNKKRYFGEEFGRSSTWLKIKERNQYIHLEPFGDPAVLSEIWAFF